MGFEDKFQSKLRLMSRAEVESLNAVLCKIRDALEKEIDQTANQETLFGWQRIEDVRRLNGKLKGVNGRIALVALKLRGF